jgi:hypothetical protein
VSDEKDPVRVGRFEWERLMLMSVPHPTNFKLLPLGVFMSADGDKARPGNANLAMFGPHEKTWAKLLRWAVDEGWLLLVARGGARRGPNGTTVVRASVYAASVPQPVWERRMEILGAPPFRAPGVEGSAPDALKGAPGGSSEGPKGASEDSPDAADGLKGALETPFNAPDPSLKGAPRDSLPDPLKGATQDFEGSDPSFEGSVSGFEGSAQTLPHHVVPSSSSSSRTSSTTVVAEDVPETSGPEPTTEGGGGGDISRSRELAEQIAAVLDYRGQWPDKRQQKTLTERLTAALDGGWSIEDLAGYLNLNGASVDSAAAVYAHRLKPGVLPEPPQPSMVQSTPQLPPVCAACLEENPAAEFNQRFRTRRGGDGTEPCPDCHPWLVQSAVSGSVADWLDGGGPFARDTADGGMWDRAWQRAQQRTANGDWSGAGTDERVAGWMAVSQQLSTADQRVAQGQALAAKFRAQEKKAITGSRPYTNDAWHRPADPAEAAKIPHCGDLDCDPVTRLVQHTDDNGLRSLTICGNCHPSMKF